GCSSPATTYATPTAASSSASAWCRTSSSPPPSRACATARTRCSTGRWSFSTGSLGSPILESPAIRLLADALLPEPLSRARPARDPETGLRGRAPQPPRPALGHRALPPSLARLSGDRLGRGPRPGHPPGTGRQDARAVRRGRADDAGRPGRRRHPGAARPHGRSRRGAAAGRHPSLPRPVGGARHSLSLLPPRRRLDVRGAGREADGHAPGDPEGEGDDRGRPGDTRLALLSPVPAVRGRKSAGGPPGHGSGPAPPRPFRLPQPVARPPGNRLLWL